MISHITLRVFIPFDSHFACCQNNENKNVSNVLNNPIKKKRQSHDIMKTLPTKTKKDLWRPRRNLFSLKISRDGDEKRFIFNQNMSSWGSIRWRSDYQDCFDP